MNVLARVRRWRAPGWCPLWVRRLFPGVWTQAEVDDIWRRAAQDHARFDFGDE